MISYFILLCIRYQYFQKQVHEVLLNFKARFNVKPSMFFQLYKQICIFPYRGKKIFISMRFKQNVRHNSKLVIGQHYINTEYEIPIQIEVPLPYSISTKYQKEEEQNYVYRGFFFVCLIIFLSKGFDIRALFILIILSRGHSLIATCSWASSSKKI